MSYENPKRAIDTQSAQYLQNMQSSLAQSFGNYAKTVGTLAQQKFAKEQKQLEQERKDSLRRREKLIKEKQNGFVNVTAFRNEPLLGKRYGQDAINAVNQSYALKIANPNGLSLEDQTIVNNVSALPRDTRALLVEIGVLVDEAKDHIIRTGKRGGAAPNQPKDAKGVRGGNLAFARAMGAVGNASYEKLLNFDLTNPNGTSFDFSTSELLDDGSYIEGYLNSAQMAKWKENPEEGFYVTIPNNEDTMTKSVNEYGLGQGKNFNIGKASSILGADIYIEDYVFNPRTGASDKVQILQKDIILERLREGSKNQIMNGMTKDSRVALINFYAGLGKTEEEKSKLEIIGYEDDLSEEQLEKLVTRYNTIQYDSFVNNTPKVIQQGKRNKPITITEQRAINRDLEITSQATDVFEAIINPTANVQLNKLGKYSSTVGPEFKSVTMKVDTWGPNEGEDTGVFTIIDTKVKDMEKDGDFQKTSVKYDLHTNVERQAFVERLIPGNSDSVKAKQSELVKMLTKKYPTPEKETKKLKFNPITKKNE